MYIYSNSFQGIYPLCRLRYKCFLYYLLLCDFARHILISRLLADLYISITAYEYNTFLYTILHRLQLWVTVTSLAKPFSIVYIFLYNITSNRKYVWIYNRIVSIVYFPFLSLYSICNSSWILLLAMAIVFAYINSIFNSFPYYLRATSNAKWKWKIRIYFRLLQIWNSR